VVARAAVRVEYKSKAEPLARLPRSFAAKVGIRPAGGDLPAADGALNVSGFD
jgi:hypothetical protein